MSNTLWPNFSGQAPPRGMREMLRDAAGDISAQTNGDLEFFIDTVGVGSSGAVQHLRHNCYLQVVKKNYFHLLFQVTTPVGSPFPASIGTPEGESYKDIKTEPELLDALKHVLQRERTKEVILFLLGTVR
jgi:hypothetical protein